MICRLWRGRARGSNAIAYERIVRTEVIPEIESRAIPGFRQIDLMKRDGGDEVEFQTLMWFDDIEAVRRFVGEDHEASHVPERARAVLCSFDERAAHYEVLERKRQPLA